MYLAIAMQQMSYSNATNVEHDDISQGAEPVFFTVERNHT